MESKVDGKAVSLDSKIKGMSYGFLLCDTFPGAFLATEILVAFHLFTPVKVFSLLATLLDKNPNLGTLALFIVAFVASTLCGFVLDGIHHFLPPFKGVEEDSDDSMYKMIFTYEQLLIYKYLIDDDLRQPAWAYANIFLAMIPGLFLMPYTLWRMSVPLWFIVIVWVLWAAVAGIMFERAKNTTILLNRAEQFLSKNFEEMRSR